jgi:Transposase DDE domain
MDWLIERQDAIEKRLAKRHPKGGGLVPFDLTSSPVSVSVFDGNTADPKTLLPQIEKVRLSFGLDRQVLAGDRGMVSNVQIEALRTLAGVDWITALNSGAIAQARRGRAFAARPVR